MDRGIAHRLQLITGLAIVGLLCLAAIWHTFDARPARMDLSARLAGPSEKHWLCTDNFGRDLARRLEAGAAASLTLAIVTVGLAATFGGFVGLVAGYAGGWIDAALMGLVDIVLAFPAFVLAMAVIAVIGPGPLHWRLPSPPCSGPRTGAWFGRSLSASGAWTMFWPPGFACEPPVLLADEPLTALDPSVRWQILGLLADIQLRRGTAILLITHDLRAASGIAHRIAVMYAGRIVETGPAGRLLAHPRHPYTAGLLAACPSMDRSITRLPVIRGAVPRPGEMPAGCAFAPRCDFAEASCGTSPPALAAQPGRPGEVACFRATLAIGA